MDHTAHWFRSTVRPVSWLLVIALLIGSLPPRPVAAHAVQSAPLGSPADHNAATQFAPAAPASSPSLSTQLQPAVLNATRLTQLYTAQVQQPKLSSTNGAVRSTTNTSEPPWQPDISGYWRAADPNSFDHDVNVTGSEMYWEPHEWDCPPPSEPFLDNITYTRIDPDGFKFRARVNSARWGWVWHGNGPPTCEAAFPAHHIDLGLSFNGGVLWNDNNAVLTNSWSRPVAGAPPAYREPLQNPDGNCPPTAGDPIRLGDGAWFQGVPCLALGGAGLPINVSLTYNTAWWADNRGEATIGKGWIVAYGRNIQWQHLDPSDPATARVPTLYAESGFRYPFTQGTYANGKVVYTASHNNFTTLTFDPAQGYTLTYRNGTEDIFDLQGTLIRVEDRYGNQTLITQDNTALTRTIINNRTGQALVLQYAEVTIPGSADPVVKLQHISDAPGNGGTPRQVTLTYGDGSAGQPHGHLVTITDHADRVYNFRYDNLNRVDTYYDPSNNPAAPPPGGAKPVVNTYVGETHEVQQQTAQNGSTITFARTNNRLTVTYNQGIAGQRSYRYDLGTGTADAGKITGLYKANSNTRLQRLTYNSKGLLESVEDSRGGEVIYTYNPSGDLAEVSSWPGGTLRMEYDDYGNRTELTDANGFVSTWDYHPATGALRTVNRINYYTPSQKQTTTYDYDPVAINGVPVSAGLPTRITLPDGTRTTQTYDALGYPDVTTYDQGAGRLNLTEDWDYDWRGHPTAYTDLTGMRTTYEYAQAPAAGQYGNRGWVSASVRDTANRNIRIEVQYDAVGNVTRVVEDAGANRLNATTLLTYQSVGTTGGYGIASVTDSLGQVTDYTYWPLGELETIVERNPDQNPATADDRTTTYSYTPEGWLHTIKDPLNRTVQTNAYYPHGQLKTTQDGRGVKSEYTYDGLGRLETIRAGVTNAGGFPTPRTQTSVTYDGNNTVVTVSTGAVRNDNTIGAGPTTTWNYTDDPYGRLAWMQTNEQGNPRTEYSYDSRNRLTEVVEAVNVPEESYTTRYAYDRMNRLTRVIVDPGAGGKNLTTQYRYITAGSTNRWMLQEVQDPKNNVTKYRYTSDLLLETVTNAQNEVWTYTYDRLGYMTGITPPRGAATSYDVDTLGQVRSLTRNGQSEYWTYATDGRPLTYTDFAAQQTTYTYNKVGNLTTLDRPGVTGDATYTYYPNGLLHTATSKPDGTTAETTTYHYNSRNVLARRTRNQHAVNYHYNERGEMAEVNYWNRGKVRYTRTDGGQVTGLDLWGQGTTEYDYRATGLLKEVTRGADNQITTAYSYDTASRLTGLTSTRQGAPVAAFGYPVLDKNGNVEQMTDANGTTMFTYDELNELTQSQLPAIAGGPDAATLNHTYDQVGNIEQLPGLTSTTLEYDDSDRISTSGYSYDTNGNLTGTPDGTTYIYDEMNRLTMTVKGATTTEYQYDALDNLVRVIVDGETTNLVLDESRALPQILGEVTGTTERLYAYGPDGFHAQRTVISGAPQDVEYPLLDRQGSVRHLTDASGEPILTRSYDAWGNVRGEIGTGETTLGYTGERMSSDGTVYLRARMYLPSVGRFLQRDPFAGFATRPLSLNRYAYTENNPSNYTDPSGYVVPLAVGVGVGLSAAAKIKIGIGVGVGVGVGVGAKLGLDAHERGKERQVQREVVEAVKEMVKGLQEDSNVESFSVDVNTPSRNNNTGSASTDIKLPGSETESVDGEGSKTTETQAGEGSATTPSYDAGVGEGSIRVEVKKYPQIPPGGCILFEGKKVCNYPPDPNSPTPPTTPPQDPPSSPAKPIDFPNPPWWCEDPITA